MPLMRLILGGCLALAAGAVEPFAHQNPAQAEPIPGDVLIAQQVVDRLPPPPQSIEFGQEQLPSQSFRPRELDFQAPQPSVPNANLESYLVYVNEANSNQLQQVQQVEPTAFVRQYNGQSVIQAGIFNKKVNAQARARELAARGIGVRIVSLATGQQTDFRRENNKSYFVVIPSNRKNLPLIEDRVTRLRMDVPVSVSQTDEPRGPHVRVGPFPERKQAESWNRYLRDFGLKNARVYYGR